MTLDDALSEFNALRHASLVGDAWASRLDRLAQAAFRAAEHLIVYGSLSPGAPNHARLLPLGGAWERGWVEGEREQVGWGWSSGTRRSDGGPAALACPRIYFARLRSGSTGRSWIGLRDRPTAGFWCRSIQTRGREPSGISTPSSRRLLPNPRMQPTNPGGAPALPDGQPPSGQLNEALVCKGSFGADARYKADSTSPIRTEGRHAPLKGSRQWGPICESRALCSG